MISSITGLVDQSTGQAVEEGRIEMIKRSLREGDIKKASQEFEAYFISYMLKVMRETVPKGSLTQNRMGEVFRSFYDETLGKESAKAGGIGLARYIEAKLLEEEVIPSEEGRVTKQE